MINPAAFGNYFFNLYAIPPLLTAVSFIFITVKMLNNWDKSNVIKYFAYLCGGVVIWLLCFSMMYLSASPKLAFFWARAGFLGVAFFPIMGIFFVYELVGKKTGKRVWYFIALSGVCVILNWSTKLIYRGVDIYFWGYYPVAGKLYFVFLIMFVLFIGLCAFTVFKEAFNYSLPVVQRHQIRYVALAFAIGTLGVVDYIGKYDPIDIYPFGYAVTFVFLGIMAFAITKHNLLGIELVLARTALYIFLYSILFGIPLLFGFKTGRWEAATFIAVVIASVGTMFFGRIQKRAENIMLAEQRSYQNILLQAATGMTQRHDLKKLLNVVVHLVKRSVKIEFVLIYLQDTETKEYKIASFRADKNHEIFKHAATFPDNSRFIGYLKTKKEPFVYEEIPRAIKSGLNFNFRIGLIVPAFTLKDVNGFMLLGEKDSRKPYSKDDIKIFNILASQTTMAVENCMFMEEFKKAYERVVAAEKLASIGGLAEGLAHQINNRLNNFSVIAGEMRYELDDFKTQITPLVSDPSAFSSAMQYFYTLSDSLTDNVKRTSSIITGILHYAKVEARETHYKEFELKEIIELSINLLNVKHNIKTAVPIDYSQAGNKTVYAIKSLIMESLYNLIDNAYEATVEMKDYAAKQGVPYAPEITLVFNKGENTDEIIITDNGMGIKQENAKKIFAPFFTTKSSYKSGTGIGMYVVKRMIEEMLKGKIWLESEYMKGTSVHISLPVKQQ